eukprot:1976298-Prymnesium_polylepis.1
MPSRMGLAVAAVAAAAAAAAADSALHSAPKGSCTAASTQSAELVDFHRPALRVGAIHVEPRHVVGDGRCRRGGRRRGRRFRWQWR